MTHRRAPCTVYIRRSDADVTEVPFLPCHPQNIQFPIAWLGCGRSFLPSILQETAMQSVLNHCPSAPARPCLEWEATTSTLERNRWKRIDHGEQSFLLMHQSYLLPLPWYPRSVTATARMLWPLSRTEISSLQILRGLYVFSRNPQSSVFAC